MSRPLLGSEFLSPGRGSLSCAVESCENLSYAIDATGRSRRRRAISHAIVCSVWMQRSLARSLVFAEDELFNFPAIYAKTNPYHNFPVNCCCWTSWHFQRQLAHMLLSSFSLSLQRLLAHFYADASDAVKFLDDSEKDQRTSFWDQLKQSLTPNLPRDLQAAEGQALAQVQVQQQALAHFWAFVSGLLVPT